ncbi:hypothetical protein JET14_10310 [Martelella lutilitoris]|uniref:DUF2946 domain-containing protein n=1 Tax=Martelella lutilitoris TaxID=2583532 RepID=A0A7T7HGH2_9HYPH|nr:hypothetical protein [Martelella lutilitoris]QQM28764.1 hypothetical protein JET14_10310 [Martelella lutilitoris]
MLGRLQIKMVAFLVLLGFMAAAGAGHAFEKPSENLCVVLALSHEAPGDISSGCDKTVPHDSCLGHASCVLYIEPDISSGWFAPIGTGGSVGLVNFITGLSLPPDTPPPIIVL